MKSLNTSNEQILKSGKPTADSRPHLFNVALVEPEIPQNTGNIGRTCVAVHSTLNLIGKLGFEITDANLRRAGLDYWQHLTWQHFEDLPSWQNQVEAKKKIYYFSAKADRSFFEADFQLGDWFVFGKETKGLPELLMQSNTDNTLLIPLLGPVRGLNLATSVAIVLYEAVRQVQNRGQLDSSYLAEHWGKVLNSNSYDQFNT